MKETARNYYADQTALRLLQIIIFILTSLLSALCLLCYHRLDLTLFLILMLLFLSTGMLLNLFFLPVYFKNLYYHITPEQIAIHRGILFQREQSIRLQSVQFVQIITGWHDGSSGLNFMILYVYGGSLLLAFMNRDDRRELTEFLEQRGIFHAP